MATPNSIVLGHLVVLDENGDITTKSRKISTRHGFVIGRDANRCQWVFQDPHMSQQHLRICIVMPPESRPELEPLVYAEDLSRNGVYWNGSLIGSKSHAFLLSNGDRLRLTSKTSLRFEANSTAGVEHFSVMQEREMRTFCSEYVITDRMLDITPHNRKFMAIEQRTRHQVACELIKLNHPTRTFRYHSTNKRPRSASDLDFHHEVQALKTWVKGKNLEIPDDKRLEKCFRISKMLHSLNHPNLLSLEKILVTDNNIYIFQELVPAGNLSAYMASKNGTLLELEAAIIIRQILSAVQALHEKYIVHRNIRPTSILISTMSSSPRFVLAGFEFARTILPQKQTRSDQTLQDTQISKYFTDAKLDATLEDLRSIGATAAFLLTGSDRLYHGSLVAQVASKSSHYFDVLPTLPRVSSLRREAIDFINYLTKATRQDRLRAQEALEHTWLNTSTQNSDIKLLCERAIQDWKPAVRKDPFIDFVKDVSYDVQGYPYSRKTLDENRPSRSKSPKKLVEAPYKPFYREVYRMANAGQKSARVPRHMGSANLRRMSADWKRGMSSSPPPARSFTVKNTTTDEFPRLRIPNRQDERTSTLRPTLTRQPSFKRMAPEADRMSTRSNLPDVQTLEDEQIPQLSFLSNEEFSKLLDDAATFEKEQLGPTSYKEKVGSSRTPIAGLHLKTPTQQSPSLQWTFNVRSASKLNARSPSKARSPVPTPKPKARGSIFDIDTSSDRALPATIPPASIRRSQEVLSGSGVTPHMAHLRLA